MVKVVDNLLSPEEFKKWVVAKWSIAPERKMKNGKMRKMKKRIRRTESLFATFDDNKKSGQK